MNTTVNEEIIIIKQRQLHMEYLKIALMSCKTNVAFFNFLAQNLIGHRLPIKEHHLNPFRTMFRN